MAEKEQIAGYDIEKECPKRMLNGPCGGVKDGKCEVDGTCVWVKIYAKLNSENNLEDFMKVRMPKIK